MNYVVHPRKLSIAVGLVVAIIAHPSFPAVTSTYTNSQEMFLQSITADVANTLFVMSVDLISGGYTNAVLGCGKLSGEPQTQLAGSD